jgi:hypothetical protein
MVTPLELVFPGLAKSGHRVTSPVDQRYNCIAFAARDTAIWWWPTPADVKEVYWPAGVERAETLSAFRALFASLGFVECGETEAEDGFEKIALFANAAGTPLHAARQLKNGRWTSKLGEREDIEHELRDLEGEHYGSVVAIMKRPLETRSESS